MSSSGSAGFIDKWALPAVLFALLGLLMVAPRALGPGTAISAGLLLLVPLMVFALAGGARLSPDTLTVVAVCTAAVALLAISAATSASPLVAYGGKLESRTGWAMWAGAVVWLWVAALLAPRSDERKILASIALMGAVAAVAALGDAAGLLGNAPEWSDKPAGIFDNALSLGQFLVIALGCAVAWSFLATSRRERFTALATALMSTAGVVLSGSRGAMVGMVLGAVVVVAVASHRWLPHWSRRVAWGMLALVALFGAAATVLAALPQGNAVAVVVDRLLTDRLTLWHAAFVDFARSPFIGNGPGMFSSFASWGLTSEGAMRTQWANDPHSVLFYWLAGGGVLGFAASLAVVFLVSSRLIRVARSSAVGASVLFATAGWFISVMFTWVNPLSLMAVAILVGTSLGRRSARGVPDAHEPQATIAAGAIAAVLVAVSIVVTLPGVTDELRWALIADADTDSRITFIRDVIQRNPDPAYAAWLLTDGLPRAVAENRVDGGVAVLEALAVVRARDADIAWYPPLALASVESLFRARAAGAVSVDEIELVVRTARLSDPASGCFDFVAADRFAQMELNRRGQAHAREALMHPLEPDVRARLERYVVPVTGP